MLTRRLAGCVPTVQVRGTSGEHWGLTGGLRRARHELSSSPPRSRLRPRASGHTADSYALTTAVPGGCEVPGDSVGRRGLAVVAARAAVAGLAVAAGRTIAADPAVDTSVSRPAVVISRPGPRLPSAVGCYYSA